MVRLNLAIMIIVSVAWNDAFSCSIVEEKELSESDLDRIIAIVNGRELAVTSRSAIRSVKSFGSRVAEDVYIEFSPHKVLHWGGYYYSLHCSRMALKEWVCDKERELREIRLSNPEDFVELEDDISIELAQELLGFLRQEIVVDDEGHYEFTQGGERIISSEPLYISSISLRDGGVFRVYLEGGPPCWDQILEVERVACGLAACELRVTRNERGYGIQ